MNQTEQQSGVTIIEVLIVIGIFGILAAIGLVFGMDFFRTYSTSSEKINLVSALSKARARSVSNIKGHEHGVHITGTQYVLFQGDGPNLTWVDRITNLDEPIPVKTGVTTGNQDIIFDQLSGNTNCSSDCSMTLSGQGRSTIVTVNRQGAILWQ